jgi:hypothetical protein
VRYHQQLTKQIFLLVTPFLAGTILASSPSWAATFATSEGQFEFTGFSQSPSLVLTNAESNTFTIGEDDIVVADAQAYALFTKLPAQAFNTTSSIAFGNNESYLGEAESEASVVGLFDVQAGTPFYFDFAGNLDLSTSIDNPSFENAKASGDISFALFDTVNNNVLEFFSLSGNLTTKGDEDFIVYDASDNVTLKNFAPVSNFGERQEFATASIEGSVKRTFATKTNLALVEVKSNKVTVKTQEPSTSLVYLFGCSVVGILLKRKRPKRPVISG